MITILTIMVVVILIAFIAGFIDTALRADADAELYMAIAVVIDLILLIIRNYYSVHMGGQTDSNITIQKAFNSRATG